MDKFAFPWKSVNFILGKKILFVYLLDKAKSSEVMYQAGWYCGSDWG